MKNIYLARLLKNLGFGKAPLDLEGKMSFLSAFSKNDCVSRKTFVIQYILLFMLLTGCDMNTRVDFILEEPEIQSENGIDVLARWKYGIQLYYFDYRPKTDFSLAIYSNENIANVQISSYSIVAPEIGINFNESMQNIVVNIHDSTLEPFSGVNTRFYGGTRVDILQSYLPDIIQNEKQLFLFKDVKYVFLHVTLEYIINNEKKISTFVWKFRPQVKRSFAFWDKLMSV
jgi:hypothetical protein